MSPLRLFGVAALDGGADDHSFAAETHVLSFHDLAAIVTETPVARPTVSADDIAQHRRVVEAVFAERTIVPAPTGVVFRAGEGLARWLELHYSTLNEALAYLDGRVGVRVHVSRVLDDGATSGERTAELGADAETMSSASFRLLRRHAVAMVPVRPARESGLFMSSASFLVERTRLVEFGDVVSDEAKRDAELRFRLTGPWPPWDFVKMQFGG